MKKGFIFLIVGMFIISSAFALQVQKVDKGSVVIAELNNPAVYEFKIVSGSSGTAEIYSLLGIDFTPIGAFDLYSGTNAIEVKAYLDKRYRNNPGNYIVEYYIKGNEPLFKDKISFRVASLSEALEFIPSNLYPGDSEINITISNVENTNFDDVELTFNSEFFTTNKKISLSPYGTTSFLLPIDKERASKLSAGKYIVSAKIEFQGAKAEAKGVINYLEKQGTSITEDSEGFLIRKTIITKKNEGNVLLNDNITLSKNIVSRLFTTSSPNPTHVDRRGLSSDYTWSKPLSPGDSWQVEVTTNYTLPFLFIILVIVVAFLVKMYSMSNLVLTKRVSHVRTKGGQFALKVSIHVKAKKHIENIQIIDRLPGMTKLYDKFGIKPSKIENETRRLFWDVQRLQAGEERVFSYIIYTSVNVVGRFELPSAVASFRKEGKHFEVLSNRAFFMSETSFMGN